MAIKRTAIGLGIAIGGGAVVLALFGAILSQKGPNQTLLTASVRGTSPTAQGTLKHAFLDLATYPDSLAGEHGKDGGAHPSWVSYGPTTSLKVPAHSLVTVTIKQYDSGGQITNPYFARVHGTLGGTITVNGKTRSAVDPGAIGHTFTIHGAPTDQDPFFLSVPLPAVPDDAPTAPGSAYPAPNVVTFSFITGGPGKYVWNCEYPCGDGYYASFGGPMATRGYMSGTFTVA